MYMHAYCAICPVVQWSLCGYEKLLYLRSSFLMFFFTNSPSARAFIPSSVIWQALRLSSARLGKEQWFNISLASFIVPWVWSKLPSRYNDLYKSQEALRYKWKTIHTCTCMHQSNTLLFNNIYTIATATCMYQCHPPQSLTGQMTFSKFGNLVLLNAKVANIQHLQNHQHQS